MINLGTKDHIHYYLFLIVVLVSGIFGITQTNVRQTQITIFALTDIAYILLGVLHHFAHHDLSMRIVLEYILIGALGFSIFLLFFQSFL